MTPLEAIEAALGGAEEEGMTSQQDARTPEQFFAIRRTDGETIGDYGWVSCDGPNDWEQAELEGEWADPESIEYEIVRMTVESIAKRSFPVDPHEHVGDECDYCGEPWPCEWVQEREKGRS